VAECAEVPVALAADALRRSSGDKSDALELLLNHSRRTHLGASLAAETTIGPTLPPRWEWGEGGGLLLLLLLLLLANAVNAN
jgi:hypothetical protein